MKNIFLMFALFLWGFLCFGQGTEWPTPTPEQKMPLSEVLCVEFSGNSSNIFIKAVPVDRASTLTVTYFQYVSKDSDSVMKIGRSNIKIGGAYIKLPIDSKFTRVKLALLYLGVADSYTMVYKKGRWVLEQD